MPATSATASIDDADREPEQDPPDDAEARAPRRLRRAVPRHRRQRRGRHDRVAVASVEAAAPTDSSLQRGPQTRSSKKSDAPESRRLPTGQDSRERSRVRCSWWLSTAARRRRCATSDCSSAAGSGFGDPERRSSRRPSRPVLNRTTSTGRRGRVAVGVFTEATMPVGVRAVAVARETRAAPTERIVRLRRARALLEQLAEAASRSCGLATRAYPVFAIATRLEDAGRRRRRTSRRPG